MESITGGKVTNLYTNVALIRAFLGLSPHLTQEMVSKIDGMANKEHWHRRTSEMAADVDFDNVTKLMVQLYADDVRSVHMLEPSVKYARFAEAGIY